MALARRLSSLGRAARSEAGVKVRQPLARALVYLPPGSPELPPGIVEDELNVDRVEAADELGEVLAYELVPNFKLLGPRIGKRVQDLRSAMATVDTGAAASALNDGRPVTVELADGPLELGAEEVELRVRAQPGFAVSRDGAEVLALDLALDDDLRRRGLAREVIRHVQDLRKETGLEVSDTIVLHVVGIDDLAPLFDMIAREVLAVRVVAVGPRGRGSRDVADARRRRGGRHPDRHDLDRARRDGAGPVTATGGSRGEPCVLAVDLGTGGPKVAVVSPVGPHRGPRHGAGHPAPAGGRRGRAGPRGLVVGHPPGRGPGAGRRRGGPGRPGRGRLHGPVVGHGGGRRATARP